MVPDFITLVGKKRAFVTIRETFITRSRLQIELRGRETLAAVLLIEKTTVWGGGGACGLGSYGVQNKTGLLIPALQLGRAGMQNNAPVGDLPSAEAAGGRCTVRGGQD